VIVSGSGVFSITDVSTPCCSSPLERASKRERERERALHGTVLHSGPSTAHTSRGVSLHTAHCIKRLNVVTSTVSTCLKHLN